MSKSNGQQFVERTAKYFSIGPSTRRWREGTDVIDRVQDEVLCGLRHAGYFSDATADAFRPAFNVLLAWQHHVGGFRIPGELICGLNQLSPYRWLKLIGRMIDDGVTNSGEAERWFRAHREELLQAK